MKFIIIIRSGHIFEDILFNTFLSSFVLLFLIMINVMLSKLCQCASEDEDEQANEF